MTGKRLAGFIAAFGVELGLAGSSAAVPITWAFEGQVTFVESETPEVLAALSSLGVSAGSSFSGRIVFESTSPDQDPDPTIGYYTESAISFFDVTVGSFHEEVVGDPYSTMYIVTLSEEFGYPGAVEGWTSGPSSYSSVGGSSLHLYVAELTPGEIASDALPQYPPGLGVGDYPPFWVNVQMGDAPAYFEGTLTQIVPVPEPGIGALVALAAIAIATSMRRRFVIGPRVPGIIVVLSLSLGWAASSAAAPITWEFEGIVRYANLGDASALGGSLGVTVGASALGRVVYESTTPDLVPGSGTYVGAVSTLEVTIDAYQSGAIIVDGWNSFYVRLRRSDTPYDKEFATAFVEPDALFPNLLAVTLSVLADTPGVIPNSSLPTAPPALAALRPFSIADWNTIGYGTGVQLWFGGTPDEQVLIEFTRLEAVPEPVTFALLAPLALALGALRRR